MTVSSRALNAWCCFLLESSGSDRQTYITINVRSNEETAFLKTHFWALKGEEGLETPFTWGLNIISHHISEIWRPLNECPSDSRVFGKSTGMWTDSLTGSWSYSSSLPPAGLKDRQPCVHSGATRVFVKHRLCILLHLKRWLWSLAAHLRVSCESEWKWGFGAVVGQHSTDHLLDWGPEIG